MGFLLSTPIISFSDDAVSQIKQNLKSITMGLLSKATPDGFAGLRRPGQRSFEQWCLSEASLINALTDATNKNLRIEQF